MAFRGLIATLPVGQTGFNGSKNASMLGPGDLSYTEGVDIDGAVLIKDGGADKLNAVALGAGVMSGANWYPAPGNPNDLVFLTNGQIRKDVGAGTFPTLLASVGVPTLFPPFFVPGGGEASGQARKMFIFNEAAQVQVIIGTANTAAAISTPPADWAASFPIFGVQHANRMWAGGNANDPHRIYFSQVTDHQIYTGAGAGSLSVFPGEGEQLVGGISFRGLLVLFKYPRGVYVVDSRDPDVVNWRVDRLNNAIGAASPFCIVQISNDILLLDSTGHFHLMSSVNDFSDVSASDISHKQNIGVFMRANVSLIKMRRAMGAWYGNKSKAWFMVPLTGSTHNNLRIIVDFNDAKAGARFYLSRRDVGDALWMRPDTLGTAKPMLGDDAGFVWLMDEEERNKDGVAYTMLMETSENDFSAVDPQLGPRTKNGQYIEVTSDLIRNSTLTVTPVWDGLAQDPIYLTLGSPAAALGSFVLDADVLSASGSVTAAHRLEGQGRRLKLIIENIELDDEVRLSEVNVGFEPGDERLKA
jgi:hypothetical protein